MTDDLEKIVKLLHQQNILLEAIFSIWAAFCNENTKSALVLELISKWETIVEGTLE